MGTERSNNFDFLRLFAAFAVMVGHSTVHLKATFLWVGTDGLPWFNDGVAVFFIISGMLVYRSYEKCVQNGRLTIDFYRNRFLRIAPAIYAYTIISVILLLIVGAINLNNLTDFHFLGWIASNFILIPVYHPDILRHIGIGVFNGSLWTIPVEFSFYLIVPIIFSLEKKIGLKKVLTILMILGLIASVISWRYSGLEIKPLWFKFFNITFFSGLIYFTLGIFWLRYWKYVHKSKYLFFAFLVLYSFGVWFFHAEKYFGPAWDLMRAIPLSYVVVWLAYNGPKIFNKFTNKIGDLSYGVYIWHMVVLNIFLFFNIPAKLNWLYDTLLLLIVFFIAFIMAKFSWTFIEKPYLKLKRFSSRTAAETTYSKNAV